MTADVKPSDRKLLLFYPNNHAHLNSETHLARHIPSYKLRCMLNWF